MEEVFSRAETQFSSVQQQIDWLSGFEGQKGEYSSEAVKARDDLALSLTIKEQVPDAGITLINELEEQSKDITITKVRRSVQNEIDSRRSQLSKEFEKVSKELEKENISKIKQAKTIEEVENIIEKVDSPTVPSKTFNKINQEGLNKIKEIRKEQASELKKKQQEAKVERLKAEKEAKEALRKERVEEEEERRAEAERVRAQSEAKKAAERQRYTERQLALQIAQNEAEAERLAEEAIERRRELERQREERA